MKQHHQTMLSLVIMAVLLSLFFLNDLFHLPPALAAIRNLEEAPGQIVYQSRQTLQDQHGDRWQVIAFNRIRIDGKTRESTSFYLRLVGFPGIADIDRSRPLTLTTALGQSLNAPDASSQIFTDESTPEPNVGQYDLQPIVSQLSEVIPIQIALPILNKDDSLLSISPVLVQEWKTVANYQSAQEESN